MGVKKKTWFFSQKIVKKIAEKKSPVKKGRLPGQKKKTRFVRNFLTKKYFFKNSDFFAKDVLRPLLGGMETISDKYPVVFVQ